MSGLRLLFIPVLMGAAALASVGACNSGMGECPAAQTIQPGASCSDENLECAYDLSTPVETCDGTAVISTSCTCTSGSWVCPSAFDCDAGSADAAPSEDAASPVDGGGDSAAAPDTGPAIDSAPPDSGAADAPVDSGRG